MNPPQTNAAEYVTADLHVCQYREYERIDGERTYRKPLMRKKPARGNPASVGSISVLI